MLVLPTMIVSACVNGPLAVIVPSFSTLKALPSRLHSVKLTGKFCESDNERRSTNEE